MINLYLAIFKIIIFNYQVKNEFTYLWIFYYTYNNLSLISCTNTFVRVQWIFIYFREINQ